MNSELETSFIKDLLSYLHEGRKREAGELLVFFPELGRKTQNRALFEISMAPSEDAYFFMETLLKESRDREIKNRLLGIVMDKARLNPEFIVLFIANADEPMLREAVPLLANILITETDPAILMEAIKAIGRSEARSCIDVVADFIFYDNSELKRAAVTALGDIGGPEVVKRLAFVLKTSKSDDFIKDTLERVKSSQTAESHDNGVMEAQFASQKDRHPESGKESKIMNLINMLDSSFHWDMRFASDKLIEMGPNILPAVSDRIKSSNPGSLINLLFVLGSMESNASVPLIMKIIEKEPGNPNVRFAAYEALCRLPAVSYTTNIINGLEDPAEHVRMAAACTVDKNLSDILLEGILAKIETGGRKSKRQKIVEALIDSRAENTIMGLLGSDSFVFLATNYLQTACTATRKHFADILNKRGRRSLARTIEEDSGAFSENTCLHIYVVDRSPVMLNYYLKEIHKTGNRASVFDHPDAALKKVETAKPDLLITCRHLKNDSGRNFAAKFASKIKAWYDGAAVPVIVSSMTEETPLTDNASAGFVRPPFSNGELKSFFYSLNIDVSK